MKIDEDMLRRAGVDPAEGLVDAGLLDETLGGVEPGLLDELVASFRDELEDGLARLRAAAGAGDAAALRDGAHFLKGAAGSLSLAALAGACHALEARAEAGGQVDAAEVAALERLARRSLAAISAVAAALRG